MKMLRRFIQNTYLLSLIIAGLVPLTQQWSVAKVTRNRFLQAAASKRKDWTKEQRDTARSTPPQTENVPKERLQKMLAHAGVSSRRRAEEIIIDGRVTVNGRLVSELGTIVHPVTDLITVDGKAVSMRLPQEMKWIALHKPKGVVTTTDDEKNRKTVLDLIPGAKRAKLLPVGRLDRNSAGIILLTNDNSFIHRLTHPSQRVSKFYRLVVQGRPHRKALQTLADGIVLPGDETHLAPCSIEKVFVDKLKNSTTFRIMLHEGRNRQLRRMFDTIGHPVLRLLRTHFCGVSVSGLAANQWRELTTLEIQKLKKIPDREKWALERRRKGYIKPTPDLHSKHGRRSKENGIANPWMKRNKPKSQTKVFHRSP
mmetsp:Transcript_9282/g.12170  ORF Transcript_9282/g.12170 Transcript_9282/m.12170 type:complete len:368 (-) Transcript_9282:161-1264(-)